MSKALNQNQQLDYEYLALQGTTESVREIYNIIVEQGLTSTNIIIEKSIYSSRSVRYALKVLLDLQLIEKKINLEDLRKSMYKVKEKRFS